MVWLRSDMDARMHGVDARACSMQVVIYTMRNVAGDQPGGFGGRSARKFIRRATLVLHVKIAAQATGWQRHVNWSKNIYSYMLCHSILQLASSCESEMETERALRGSIGPSIYALRSH